ncbi:MULTISPECIES: RNA polymerase subunit sigma-70 [unclassified Streptomyces]|uniref:RNA polymerase subunit sigma-70 n=1 Tax=unclassified Streptomyces TaxID=2593676 RepID=UPI001907B5AD|nr:RNA polymerase subunit sigma-70 [Streptomyces sp. HSG2]
MSRGAHELPEFEDFVAGAAGRLSHTATLLTAEPPADNPRARRLLARSLAETYARWDRLRGDDPYVHARSRLAGRFARESAWRRRGSLRPGGAASPASSGPLARLTGTQRLIVVFLLVEGVAEEQTAALLAMPVDRVRAIRDRSVALLLHPPRPRESPRPAPEGTRRATPGSAHRGRR